MSKPNDMDFEDYDKKVQEMEERFGGQWQELCLDIINAPAAYTLDTLWEKMILARSPNYVHSFPTRRSSDHRKSVV